MADGFGGMPFSPEMNPFQAEIGSNQRLVTGGDLQDGAIISDASSESSSAMSLPPDARDEQSFGERHDAPNDIQWGRCSWQGSRERLLP